MLTGPRIGYLGSRDPVLPRVKRACPATGTAMYPRGLLEPGEELTYHTYAPRLLNPAVLQEIAQLSAQVVRDGTGIDNGGQPVPIGESRLFLRG